MCSSWRRGLTNFCFADDIVLLSSSAAELGSMTINELEVGLKLNTSKTKLMTNSIEYWLPVDGAEMGYIQEYIYLGQETIKKVASRNEKAYKS